MARYSAVKAVTLCCLAVGGTLNPAQQVAAEDPKLPAKPRSVRKIVSDGRHNAFAAFVKWKGEYWLAFRKGTGHVARDGDLVVLRSGDTKEWQRSTTFDVAGDDRDAQLLPTENRLFLYINSLHNGRFDVFVSYTDDGTTWSKPEQVYRNGFILWKPTAHGGRYYAGAHRPTSNNRRESHLVTSSDGIQWEKISTIRAGHGESETTLLFRPNGRLTAFLRSQINVGGAILESTPPYKEWKERPAGIHLSGHAVYTFDGVTYMMGRHLSYNPPVDPGTPRSQVAGRKLDQATMVYTYEGGKLKPYCLLGPLDGNHDSSYAAAVRYGKDMLVVYHRAAHEYAGEFRAKDAADIFLARVPLKTGGDFIAVRNANALSVDRIPCERIPLGEVDDYKPTIALMPDGELLLSMFSGRRLDDGKIAEQTILCRSSDGGKTWSQRETPNIAGREPALSITQNGTVLITTHLLAQDVRNKDGYTHSYVHRSSDSGRTWTSTRVEPKEFRPRTTGLTSRSVLELADGSLLLGISEHGIKNCKSSMWRSTDSGKTWAKRYPAHFADVPRDYPYTLFGKAHLWQARSGKLYAVLRVGAGNTWPLPGTTDPGNNDQSERMIVYSSEDMGRNWEKVRDLGGYGKMYMSILRLGQGRLLLTFTQRAIERPLGVRAVLGRESQDGFRFDLDRDQIMLDTKTPDTVSSGGGFGPTVRLADGTLVTSYTYRDADNRKHAEVVRWRMPVFKFGGRVSD